MNAQQIIEEILQEDGTLTLLHFSDKAYLKRVDPKFQGAAQAGEERGSADYRRPAFSHWYVQSRNSYIEPLFWNTYVYSAQVKMSQLNDQRLEYLENREAKRRGFLGVYFNFEKGEEQVRLFVPMPVKLLGKTEVPDDKQYGQITGDNILRYVKQPTF